MPSTIGRFWLLVALGPYRTCRSSGTMANMQGTLRLHYPFTGRWQVRNSPADRVPSHGSPMFGLSYAIDFVPVDERDSSAPFTVSSFFRPEPPTRFAGFGRVITAPVDGTVLRAHDSEIDHKAYRGIPSVRYALAQRRRLARGIHTIVGNHMLIETTDHNEQTAIVALCHLQQHSITVEPGQRVRHGEIIGRCGNSGNSTEPHLHLHALDGADLVNAAAVPISFQGHLPANGETINIRST